MFYTNFLSNEINIDDNKKIISNEKREESFKNIMTVVDIRNLDFYQIPRVLHATYH